MAIVYPNGRVSTAHRPARGVKHYPIRTQVTLRDAESRGDSESETIALMPRKLRALESIQPDAPSGRGLYGVGVAGKLAGGPDNKYGVAVGLVDPDYLKGGDSVEGVRAAVELAGGE